MLTIHLMCVSSETCLVYLSIQCNVMERDRPRFNSNTTDDGQIHLNLVTVD